MPTVETNGVDLYYERRGTGPPVIFLHGAGLDHRLFAEVAKPLTDDYEVIVLDRRFHGRSGGDPTEDVTMDTYVEDLHVFIDALELDAPVIVGHSMGGMVALRYADRYSEEITGVITLGSETPDHPTPRTRFYQRVVFPLHDWLLDTIGHAASDRFMVAVNWLTRDDAALSDLETFERIIEDHHADYPEASQAEGQAIEASLETYEDLDIDYEAINTPFLATYGEQELEVIADYATHMANRIPHCRAVEIPDAAHVSPVDNPEFVIDTIEGFLDEHVTAEPAAAAAVADRE